MDVNLFDAIERGDTEQVASLLSAGANCNVVDQWGRPALNRAIDAINSNFQIVQLLLHAGADVNGRTVKVCENLVGGETPLHVAAAAGPVEIADLLLKTGAELEAKDEYGETPIMHALGLAVLSVDMVRFLIKCGANVNVVAGDYSLLDVLSFSEEDRRVKEKIYHILIQDGAK